MTEEISKQDAAQLAILLRHALTMMARKTWTKDAKALLTKLGYLTLIALTVYATSASTEERPNREYRLYDQQSRPEGVIRQTEPNTYQMYNNESKRTGTIYVRPDGHIDIFAPDGKRIGPRVVPSTPYQPARRTP